MYPQKKKWFKPQVFEVSWWVVNSEQKQTIEEVNILITRMVELKNGLSQWQSEMEEWKDRQVEHLKNLGLSMTIFQNSFEDKLNAHAKNLDSLDKRVRAIAFPFRNL